MLSSQSITGFPPGKEPQNSTFCFKPYLLQIFSKCLFLPCPKNLSLILGYFSFTNFNAFIAVTCPLYFTVSAPIIPILMIFLYLNLVLFIFSNLLSIMLLSSFRLTFEIPLNVVFFVG